jgi:hypothetical protein
LLATTAELTGALDIMTVLAEVLWKNSDVCAEKFDDNAFVIRARAALTKAKGE